MLVIESVPDGHFILRYVEACLGPQLRSGCIFMYTSTTNTLNIHTYSHNTQIRQNRHAYIHKTTLLVPFSGIEKTHQGVLASPL